MPVLLLRNRLHLDGREEHFIGLHRVASRDLTVEWHDRARGRQDRREIQRHDLPVIRGPQIDVREVAVCHSGGLDVAGRIRAGALREHPGAGDEHVCTRAERERADGDWDRRKRDIPCERVDRVSVARTGGSWRARRSGRSWRSWWSGWEIGQVRSISHECRRSLRSRERIGGQGGHARWRLRGVSEPQTEDVIRRCRGRRVREQRDVRHAWRAEMPRDAGAEVDLGQLVGHAGEVLRERPGAGGVDQLIGRSGQM